MRNRNAFSPGAQVQPYAANLIENIAKRKLRVDRAIVPMSELTKTQNRANPIVRVFQLFRKPH